jgi:TP901 family phage tail tape measure protein
MQTAAVLSILVRANTKGAVAGIARVQTQLGATEAAGHKALGAVKTFAKGSAIAAGGGIAYAVTKAADFEQQLSSLGSVSGATGREMEKLRKQAMKAGADTKFSALEAAKAQTELAKGGLSVSQIMRGGLRSSLALAAAGEMELAEAAATTANAINLFGLRGRDSIKVADMLATAANATTADVADFAIALQQGGSVAKTSGLSLRETVLALEALAKSGIKGSDAGTSLKTSLVQLLAPSEKQAALADELNLKFTDQEGKVKSLAAISTMLRDRLGGMTKAQRLATLATLAGTDGVRTLTALYDAGAPRLSKWERGLAKQGTAADVAAQKQDNFRGKLENLKGSIETAAIAIGTKMLPTLTRAAERVTDIINDPKLTSAEKFTRLANMVGNAFGKAIPLIADAAAKAAPIAAGAFVKGFLAAGVWGRLVIGGWLLSRMGGPPAFMRIGNTAGTAMGAGMATGVAGSGLKGRLAGMFKTWGPTMAVGAALAFGPELVKAIKRSTDAKKPEVKARMVFEDATRGDPGFTTLVRSLRRVRNETALTVDKSSGAWKVFADKIRAHNREARGAFDSLAEPVRRAQRIIQRMSEGSSQSIRSLRTNVRIGTQGIKQALGEDSKAGKEAMSKHFAAAARNVRRSMREGTISTREGTKEIERLMVLALQNMGFTKKQALNVRKGQDPVSGKPIGTGNMQRGGPITEGQPSGDTVPAILERGEYVLNRNAVRKIGRKQLDQLNFSRAPRFQGGGIVELLHPFNDPAGHGGANSHLHIAMTNVRALIALGRRLQRQGWMVGEHPAFGGIQGAHDPQGYHYTNQAIDVNWPDAGQEAAKIKALLPLLDRLAGGAGGLGGVAPKLARLLVEGPDSPLKALVQRSLDVTRSAAQDVLNRQAGPTEGVESVPGGDFNKRELMRLWVRAGGAPRMANLMAAIALAESGGRSGIVNSIGATGLWQIHPGGSQYLDPLTNARTAVSKLATQGLGAWEAYTRGMHTQFLQQGGLVGMQLGGDPLRFRDGMGGRARGPSRSPRAPRGLPRQLERTLGILRKSAKTKVRSRALRDLLGRIRKVGLPANLQKNLDQHEQQAAVFGDMADRASQLTVEPLDEGAEPILGTVGGLTEADWLNKQLETLFAFRNALIRAHEIVVQRREMITKLIEQAQERLQQVADAIRAAAKVRHALEKQLEQTRDQLEKAREHPRRNREQIKLLRARAMQLYDQIGGIDKQQDRRGRVRDKLKDRIIPALTDKRSALNTARGELLTSLDTVQGPGSPMERLSSLPEVGVLGGDIFAVQMRLRELAQPRERITDTATDVTEESESAALLRELLREANLRTAVSQAQYKVLQEFPSYMGAFQKGGVALVGERGPELAHMPSGTRIHSAADTQAMLAPTVVIQNLTVYEDGRASVQYDGREFEVAVERATRRMARGRPLPGRGGGLT